MSAKPAKLTDQQSAAITTREVSVSLTAGAGCGKTFVLTRRFLSHLEPGPDIKLSGLVAITFTERAAREMRERIRDACLDRLHGCEATDADHWLGLTREIDSARVSTIHSFCASVLRNAAVEARLDPQFGLLEPQIGSSFLNHAVTEALHASVARQLPAAIDTVHTFGLERTIAHCELLVRKRFSMQRDQWLRRTPEQLAELWQQQFNIRVPSLVLNTLREFPEVRTVLHLLELHSTSNATMQERRQLLIEELRRLLDSSVSISDPLLWLQRLREAARVQGGGGKKAWDSDEIFERVKESISDLRDVIDKVTPQLEFVVEDVLPAAKLSLQMLELVSLAIDQYELRKAEAAVLDFDDLVLRTRDLLQQNSSVRQRVSASIDFLMVDEFQDTDPIQADIVRHLCGPRLTTGKLFLVGDPQQSIYRFRRADPNVFWRLRQEIPAAGQLPLNRNFRSQPAILDFVNALFADALGSIFQPLIPAVQQLSPAPSIEFLFAIPADPAVADKAETRRMEEATWMARRLRELLDDPTPRIREKDATGQTTLRRVQPGDIVILFRALTDIRYYEQALRDCRLEYYLVGGRAFYAQQEVFDLLNLLRFLNEPDDEISLLGVLRSPFFGLTDDTLTSLRRSRVSLDDGLQNPPPGEIPEDQHSLVMRAREVLNELRQVKDRLSLTELLARIFDLTAYDASLVSEFLGRRKLANLRKLMEMARQFDRAGGLTLADFVERLKGAVAEETDEELAATQAESSDVIRIMTIHQSKGLEFPVVVVADMDRSGSPPPSPVEFSTELGPLVGPPERYGRKSENLGLRLHRLLEQQAESAEHLRLLYVALTRAADHLILSAGMKAIDKPGSGWMKLVTSRLDLATGRPVLAANGNPVISSPFVEKCPPVLVHRVPPRAPLLPPAIHERLSLRDFKELVTQAEPLPLPPLLRTLSPNPAERFSFSVSELEGIDEDLRGVSSQVADDIKPQIEGSMPSAEDVGTLVHAVLERMDPRGDETQFARLLEACWTGTFAGLPDDIRQSAHQMLTSFWHSPVCQELRSARQCLREIEFNVTIPTTLLPGPTRCISGKIDCLIQAANGNWMIFDYKTGGRFARQNPQLLLEHYEFQLGVYAWAIRDALGLLPARVAIITFQPEVSVVNWTASEAALNKVQFRAAAAIAKHLSQS